MRGMLTPRNRLENLRQTLISKIAFFFCFRPVDGTPREKYNDEFSMLKMIDCYGKLLDLEIFLKKKAMKIHEMRYYEHIFFEQEIAYFSPVTMGKMRKDQTCQKQTQRIKEHFCHKSFFLSLSNKHFN